VVRKASCGISMGHQCCAVATAAAVVIDPGRRCHVLVTVYALGVGASHCRLAQHGGNHGQRRQRFSAVLLYGIIRHGDCPRGREPAHLMQPLCLATRLGAVCAST
jgi:hypothetical protein